MFILLLNLRNQKEFCEVRVAFLEQKLPINKLTNKMIFPFNIVFIKFFSNMSVDSQ